MKLSKKGYVHHPVGAIIVGFLVGMLVMYLMCKGIIPLGDIRIC